MALFGPKIPKTQMSRLNVSLDPSTPRKAVFGTTAMPLDLRYHESSGTDQEYVDYIIAVAAHKVTSITEIWFEENKITYYNENHNVNFVNLNRSDMILVNSI